MELQTQNIINLHKIDKKLAEIEQGKGDLPALINDLTDKRDELNQVIEESKGAITALEKDKSSHGITITEFKSKLDKYNKQFDVVKTNEAYDALVKEIDYINQHYKEVQLTIEKIDVKIKDLEQLINENEEKNNSADEKLSSYSKELEIVSVESKTEQESLIKRKKSILSLITDEDFLNKYKSDEDNIIASLSRGSCTNCFSSLPDQFVFDIKKGEKLYSCTDCGVYLYYDDEEEN